LEEFFEEMSPLGTSVTILVGWKLARETDVLAQFVFHKCHMTWDLTRATRVGSLNIDTGRT
jgi:hypothetical protein